LYNCETVYDLRRAVRYEINREEYYLSTVDTEQATDKCINHHPQTQHKLLEKVSDTKQIQHVACDTVSPRKVAAVNAIVCDNSEDKYLIMQWSHHEVRLFKDKGSDVNILGKNFVVQHALRTHKTNRITLKNVFGKITDTEETVKLTLRLGDLLMNIDFYIADIDEDALIGHDSLKEIVTLTRELERYKMAYPVVFGNGLSAPYPGIQCQIPTKPGALVCIRPYKIAHAVKAETQKTIDTLVERGFIVPSKSSWSNPMRPVKKPDGTIRITINFQALNKLVDENKYGLPVIQKVIEKTQGKRFFTVIDLKDGYFQIALDAQDRHKTAFRFENKLYEWVRMPQGFKNSPALFQSIIDDVLSEILDDKCCAYLDDIVVFGENESEHDNNLREVLDRLQKSNLKVNMSKMQYKQKEVKLLGAIIDGVTQRPIPSKQAEVLNFQTPRTKKDLQRFLGFVNYYRRYISNFAIIAVPLYDALKGKSETLGWTPETDKAFNDLKNSVNSDVVLYLPDYSKHFVLTT
ncbi:hypothetical protein PAPHI01_2742, partial [Pancytospora philotis]